MLKLGFWLLLAICLNIAYGLCDQSPAKQPIEPPFTKETAVKLLIIMSFVNCAFIYFFIFYRRSELQYHSLYKYFCEEQGADEIRVDEQAFLKCTNDRRCTCYESEGETDNVVDKDLDCAELSGMEKGKNNEPRCKTKLYECPAINNDDAANRIVTCSHCQTSYNSCIRVHLNGKTLKRALDRKSFDDKWPSRLFGIKIYFLFVVCAMNVPLVVFGGPHFEELHTEFKQFMMNFVRETAAQIV